jgi:RNA polymerase sigma factor (sigma-70 family)
MPTARTSPVIHQLRRAALLGDIMSMTDGELLDCFITRRDEAAFEALLRRHGPMVLNLCRRMIGNFQDAEDAFQAAFLVLARKAALVVPRESVGNWLYGVAYRTARRARAVSARHHAREKQVKDMPHPVIDPPRDQQDVEMVLDEELNRLPAKYRLPVVLCELEGRSRKEVARQLKLPEGTLSSRLATARRMLARRLTRRGVALGMGAMAAALSQGTGAACLSKPLILETMQAVSAFTMAKTLPGVVSAPVAALAEGVLKTMMLTKLKTTATIFLLLACAGIGAGLEAQREMALKMQEEAMAQRVRSEQMRREAKDAIVYEQPKGKIDAIDRESRFAYINIGAAEGVKPLLTFSVYSPSSEGNVDLYRAEGNQAARDKKRAAHEPVPKGTLEVVSILGPHSSKARITGVRDQNKDPLVRGDLIWDRVYDALDRAKKKEK